MAQHVEHRVLEILGDAELRALDEPAVPGEGNAFAERPHQHISRGTPQPTRLQRALLALCIALRGRQLERDQWSARMPALDQQVGDHHQRSGVVGVLAQQTLEPSIARLGLVEPDLVTANALPAVAIELALPCVIVAVDELAPASEPRHQRQL